MSQGETSPQVLFIHAARPDTDLHCLLHAPRGIGDGGRECGESKEAEGGREGGIMDVTLESKRKKAKHSESTVIIITKN